MPITIIPPRARTLPGAAVVLAAALLATATGRADPPNKEESYKPVTTITVPGNPLLKFDISFVDPSLHEYLLADRSNAALDVFDTSNNTLLFQVGGFAGAQASNDLSGPNGVVTVVRKTGDPEAWVGDGPDATKVSSLKVVDLTTKAITHTIYTGGSFRADELAYDPLDGIVAIANDADTPPFLTFIATTGPNAYKVLGQLKFDGVSAPKATNGLEQTQFWAETGFFYLAVPEVNGDVGHGEIAVINPKTMKVVDGFPIGCEPAGLTIGPENFALAGCSDGPVQQIDLRSGTSVHTFTEVGGADQVWFDEKSGHYFVAASGNVANGKAAPVLGILDAQTRQFDQNFPTVAGDHSVAADSNTGHVFLPTTPVSAVFCPNGCVVVFACTAAARHGHGHGDRQGPPNSCEGPGQGD